MYKGFNRFKGLSVETDLKCGIIPGVIFYSYF